jgi:ubiquinone/menaquinone biosynthesis C-methylase UbiE
MTDLGAVKERQQQMWGTANYASVGARVVLVSELLCEAVDLQGGERVLDVACGNGNTALAASRRFADVVGVDYQPRLLEQARERAAVEGLPARFEEADAEALPFDDDSFDVVLSTCGVMFAPDHQRAADELVRVCRPGGRIGMVNWTPSSWVAEVGRTVGRYVPPPQGVLPPVLWGEHDHLASLFGDRVSLTAPTRQFLFRFASAQQHVDYFSENYPPIVAALGQLDEQSRGKLRDELRELAERMNVAEDKEGLVLPLEYLEVVATVRG